jgi:CubicO group peptidase (beta-lactamase class C family)
MKTFSVVALLICTASSCLAAGPRLPRSSPEAQGVSSAALLAFVEEADRKIEAMNSFMLVRHGHVVAEGWWSPYDAASPHSLYSLSKSFTSTAVGLAIAEGKLSLDDEVLKFFPEDAPKEPSKNLKSMRVSDLLRMSTGHQAEPARTPDRPWTKGFLAQAVPHKPGTHFLYNTSATYMLSAIVQKATGTTVLDFLRPRLFDPLGIEHPTWEASPQGISAGSISRRASGTGRRWSPKPGWTRPRPARPPTAATRRVIGIRATATSSGGAATTPTGATAHSGNTASCSRTRMPSSPSPAG